MIASKILFLTCMPLTEPRTASMRFMGVLLEEYPKAFTWFSTRSPRPNVENPFNIPYEFSNRLKRPTRIPYLRQFLNLGPWARYLGRKAAVFGREQNVEVVLADLAFEAVVAGRIAAKALEVPLLVSVHDDPVNRIEIKGYPDWLVRFFEANLDRTMRRTTRCGVICKYMGEIYEERYSVETHTLFIGAEKCKCLPTKSPEEIEDPILIGSVGSVNSINNWNLLMDSIRLLNQRYDRIKFRILHIGNISDDLQVPNEVEVTGWVPEEEFRYHLSRIDAGFLNWSFDPKQAETSRTSFPLKIHSYIEAQRPMIALGPSDSSVIRFVDEFNCGITCTVPDVEKLADKIEQLMVDKRYRQSSEQVRNLMADFSRDAFFRSFESFIDISTG